MLFLRNDLTSANGRSDSQRASCGQHDGQGRQGHKLDIPDFKRLVRQLIL